MMIGDDSLIYLQPFIFYEAEIMINHVNNTDNNFEVLE